MKEKSICEEFAAEHGILPNRIAGSEIHAIYWLKRISQLSLQSANKEKGLIYDPSWGFVHLMLDRVYDHVASSFIQYCLGFPTSGEILARTAIESSVNALYILQSKNRIEKIFECLTSYIEQERKQNKQWKEIVDKLPANDQSIHMAALSQKAQYLDIGEKILTRLCETELSIPYPSPKSWGNIHSRFKEIGEEMTYRTTYAAASSEVHSDAEDLLNRFLVTFSSDPETTKTELSIETSNFSRMIIYQGLRYYLEVVIKYCNIFNLREPISEVKIAQKWVDEFIVEIAKNINSNVE